MDNRRMAEYLISREKVYGELLQEAVENHERWKDAEGVGGTYALIIQKDIEKFKALITLIGNISMICEECQHECRR